MNSYVEKKCLRSILLLGALTAGGIMTRVIPTYEEIVAHRDERPKPAAESRQPRYDEAGGMTGIDVDHRQLRIIGSIV